MPIIDAHAHIYPEKVAAKAVSAVGRFYGVEQSMAGKGSPTDLLTHREAGHHALHRPLGGYNGAIRAHD